MFFFLIQILLFFFSWINEFEKTFRNNFLLEVDEKKKFISIKAIFFLFFLNGIKVIHYYYFLQNYHYIFLFHKSSELIDVVYIDKLTC